MTSMYCSSMQVPKSSVSSRVVSDVALGCLRKGIRFRFFLLASPPHIIGEDSRQERLILAWFNCKTRFFWVCMMSVFRCMYYVLIWSRLSWFRVLATIKPRLASHAFGGIPGCAHLSDTGRDGVSSVDVLLLLVCFSVLLYSCGSLIPRYRWGSEAIWASWSLLSASVFPSAHISFAPLRMSPSCSSSSV